MDFRKVIILAILLGLIIPAVGAADPGQIILSGGADWLVANGTDSAGITVQVLDKGGTPLANRTVTLSVDSAFGHLSPATVTTGAPGAAVTRFTAGKTSGIAIITARAGAAEAKFEQKIDHDTPGQVSYLDYDGEVTAGDRTTIVARFADRHGNPVDDRRTAETVRFSVGSAGDDAAFIDDGGMPVRELERTINATGFVLADLETGRTAGENIIRMTVHPGAFDRYISVRGLPTGLPVEIDISVSPDADPFPYQPANGEDTFTLTCRLFDAWGNPAAGRDLRVNTSLGESHTLTTNGMGIARLTYGPKDSTGSVAITATATDNASVTTSQTVEFIHTDPVNMLLSASPQSMPSRDLDKNTVSELRAKVMDIKGNPVAGEEVTFTLDVSSIDLGGSTQIGAPSLEMAEQNKIAVDTDDDGYAIARFIPGSFARPKAGELASAKGTATVRATWGDITRNITLTWMNYPYLSVETGAINQTVEVNDTIDVTIRLKGDGYAMYPDPIDVVLVMDRSLSMKGQRITDAKAAAKAFVEKMDPARDKIGLVSYSTSTSCDLPLTYDYSGVNGVIGGLTPILYTATREALYVAIQEMIANKSSDHDAVHAVILMSDGEYNYYGDPLARGTGSNKKDWKTTQDNYYKFSELANNLQNMSVYAKTNNVRLYMISFSNDITQENTTWKTMDTLAEATGGKHYHAVTGADLARIYTEIAGDLKTEAGVDTTMTLDFDTIRVNDEYRPGSGVFTYIHEDGISTAIRSWVDNETGHHDIVSFHTIDQTDDWNNTHTLAFDIGTVHLDQIWEAKFRLRVLTDGNINIFGPNSTIRFNGGAAELDLPDTYITAVPDLTDTGLGSGTLHLSNPRYTPPGPALEFITAAWDISYTGAKTVTEIAEYSNDGGLSWVWFDTQTAGRTTTGGVATLDVRDLPSGEYRVRIRASADDAPDAGLLFPPISVGERPDAYIRLS